jgi:phage gp45-like
MHGKIDYFYDECYCVRNDNYFSGIDAYVCVEATSVKILSGCYTGEQAIFQKDGEKLSLIGADFIIEDIQGIEIEIEE